MSAPVLSFENLGLNQGVRWLFRGIDLHIAARDRLALIGRNGTGKTTLLRLIAEEIEADEGRRTIVPGTHVVLLEQDPDLAGHDTLKDWALHGEDAPEAHEVEAIAGQLGIDLAKPAATASGGERRRAAISRALAQNPDVLLLDEPTNHLDLAAIDWLEDWLGRYTGAFIAISHDRTFLKRLTKATLWLDRGTLRRADIGFGGYDAWVEKVYADEAKAAERMDAKLKIETHWLHRGVTARRKRNQGRLTKLWELREQRAEMLGPTGTAKLAISSDEVKTKSVIFADNISKSFGTGDEQRVIIKDFTLRIQRGDRIGIVGANGAGKTTLLKLLTGEIEPDSGRIRRAKTLDSVVIDQQRSLLQPDKRLRDILADGGDWIDLRGERKRIEAYLKDFLFDPGLADAKVGTLSGGEQSRLLLAREFSKLSNLLVLDEPTNDLDMETLDLLQEVIADYDGTVLIVSHDRDFLDRTVTITLGLDGSGTVDIVAGGYEDWEKRRRPARTPSKKPGKKAAAPPPPSPSKPAKLSYKDQRDLDRLPGEIEKLEAEIAEAEEALADPDLYRADPDRFHALTKRIETARAAREAHEERWLEVAEMAEALGAG
ncbi:ABC-F family ATP-binding cassette domain-containing protein [Parasphingopyxis marina]|uniref:ABC-F family ATP-binding cassette domain-containing protein n=1 Tax=Parasphingopyxis marina TaxID=2761622 RepID=A0A842HU29_9SPHN|nr:ABC-F family ATP-binding cassette domain-containing protein [Parasphingopyxis marina]MBC2776532.1 ABC-F family ATP-binding cassette domain-containing protein [Parasphingopyxis marina]